MRTNGFLWYAIVGADNGIDEDGEPIAAATEWSEPIPCLIQFNTNTKGTYVDGSYKQVTYKIHVERIPLSVSQVKLEKDGQPLGEFEVLGKPNKTTMGRTILYA